MCFLGVVWLVIETIFGFAVPEATAPYVVTGNGCVAVYGASCSYRAQETGSIEAMGSDWRVEIERGERTIVYRAGDFGHVSDGVLVARDVIRRGDRVSAETSDSSAPFSFVSIGTPLKTP